MVNKFIFMFNKFFSLLARLFKKICINWAKLRKFLVATVFVVFFIFYIQSPDIKLLISNTARLTILQYEKMADDYVRRNDFDNAINQYEGAVSIILSQKDMTDINIDRDIQYRICKKSANAFLKYSYSNDLDERHKKTGRNFIDGLNLQKKYFNSDTSIDSLIQKLNLIIGDD